MTKSRSNLFGHANCAPSVHARVHVLKYTVLMYLITCINVLLLFLPEFESLPWVVRGFCKVEGVLDLELLSAVLGCGRGTHLVTAS